MKSISKKAKVSKETENKILRSLLGQWLNLSIQNGTVYKTGELGTKTAAILFPHRAENLEKLLHLTAG